MIPIKILKPNVLGWGLTFVMIIIAAVLVIRLPRHKTFTAEIKHIDYGKQVEVIVTGCCGAAAQNNMEVTEIEFDRPVPVAGSNTTVVWLDSSGTDLRNTPVWNRYWKYQSCKFDNRYSSFPIICGLTPKN